MIFIDSKNISDYAKLNFKTNESIFIFINESVDTTIEFSIDKPDLKIEMFGVIFLTKNQTVKLRTKSIHAAPRSFSRVHFKGVFDDQSNFDYQGMINIQKGALLSDAYLQNDNLIIGSDAVVNSSPQLEICADDVKASHGVTVATYDAEDQYYINSRGISDAEARRLMVYGFINDIITKSENPEKMSKMILSKI